MKETEENFSTANPPKSSNYKISMLFSIHLFAFVAICLFWCLSYMLKVFSKFPRLFQQFKMVLHQ